MPAGYITARVYRDHDTRTWYAVAGREGVRPRPLTATGRAGAQSEAETLLAAEGLRPVSPWKGPGDDEAGARAVFAQAGSGDAAKGVLETFWGAHRELLAGLGVNLQTLTPAQRATLLSHDAMLAGLARVLVDRGVLTDDDLTAASGAARSADLTGFPGL
ncbi:hypothetical protein ABTY20_22940 [Streptomyces sp. NPDC126497]|uniref:hypothetical protein n=1 Tax=Streptomyces sp. NPDC126497 TaxID=3155313 RepID=UPI0033288A99